MDPMPVADKLAAQDQKARLYKRPYLERFGSVADLTAAGGTKFDEQETSESGVVKCSNAQPHKPCP